jgi:hypothetical protein
MDFDAITSSCKILGNVFSNFHERLKLHICCYIKIKGSPVLYPVITSRLNFSCVMLLGVVRCDLHRLVALWLTYKNIVHMLV